MESLPDDVVLFTLSYISPSDLQAAAWVATQFLGLAGHGLLWRRAALSRWRNKQMDTAGPLLDTLRREKRPWREIYREMNVDGERAVLSEEELCRLTWSFIDGREHCDFRRDGSLMMELSGEFSWSMEEDSDGVRYIQIANFPPHYIERTANWGWVIKNKFIYIISIAGRGGGGGGGGTGGGAGGGAGVTIVAAGKAAGAGGVDEEDECLRSAYLCAVREAGSVAQPL